MKTSMICTVILLCLGAGVCAQYIYNPPTASPSVGTCNSWPFGVYTEWRFSFIIDASVMPKTPVLIQDIAFAPCSSGTWSCKQLQFRMGHTTHKDYSNSGTTKFDDILGLTPTVLFNGPMTWTCTSNTWCDIGLTSPFVWDGVQNICGEIRYQGRGSLSLACHRQTTPRAYIHTGHTANPYNATNWYVPIPGEMNMLIHRLTVKQGFFVDADASVPVGKTANILLKNGVGGEFYQAAASLSMLPLNLGKCTIYLTPDNLFWASIQIGPPTFNRYSGTLSAAGSGAAQLAIPNIPALAGVTVYHAAVSYTAKAFPTDCSNTDLTKIVP